MKLPHLPQNLSQASGLPRLAIFCLPALIKDLRVCFAWFKDNVSHN